MGTRTKGVFERHFVNKFAVLEINFVGSENGVALSLADLPTMIRYHPCASKGPQLTPLQNVSFSHT